MQPLLIAAIFIVMMAFPAILAVRYAAKPRKQPVKASRNSLSRFGSSNEGSVILPVSVSATVLAHPGPVLISSGKRSKRAPMDFAAGEVNEVIERLILSSQVRSVKRLS